MTTNTSDLDWQRQFDRWIAGITSGTDADAAMIHLGDLRAACLDIVSRLDRLPTLRGNQREVRQEFAELRAQLYEHMLPHMNHLREPLDSIVKALYDRAEQRGELD